MLRPSRKTMLAIEAVLDIALHARPDPVQSKEITRRQGVPQRYLEQVMQQLVHEGILKGVRGPKGGYTLARERRRITVGEIVRIVDALEQADEAEGASRSGLSEAVVVPVWQSLREAAMARLDDITIEDLCRDARRLGVEGDGMAEADFTI